MQFLSKSSYTSRTIITANATATAAAIKSTATESTLGESLLIATGCNGFTETGLGRDIFAFGKDTEGLADCFGAAVGKTILGAEAAAAGFAAGASGRTVFAAEALKR